MAISVLQNGQTFVVGACGASLLLEVLAAILFTTLREVQKMTNAITRKLITADIKFHTGSTPHPVPPCPIEYPEKSPSQNKAPEHEWDDIVNQ